MVAARRRLVLMLFSPTNSYMRLGEEDYDDRRNAFQRCFRASACLGARRELPPRERPGTKHAFTTYIRPPIDCCSAVDPLEEDLVGCEKVH